MYTTLLTIFSLIIAHIACGITVQSETISPDVSPHIIFHVDEGVDAVRCAHVMSYWDMQAPPATHIEKVRDGKVVFPFTHIPFGTNTIELIAHDGTRISEHSIIKWVTRIGTPYCVFDETPVCATTIYSQNHGIDKVFKPSQQKVIYRGKYPRLTIIETRLPSKDGVGTITFTCDNDGVYAVWGKRRIIERDVYTRASTTTVTFTAAEYASFGTRPTLRIENGYAVAMKKITFDPAELLAFNTWQEKISRSQAEDTLELKNERITQAEEIAIAEEANGILNALTLEKCIVRTDSDDFTSGHCNAQFVAETDMPRNPLAAENGMIAINDSIVSGIWRKISTEVGTREVYSFSPDNTSASLAGIVRLEFSAEGSICLGDLRLLTRELSFDKQVARADMMKMTLTIGWGEEVQSWDVPLDWTQTKSGAYKGILQK